MRQVVPELDLLEHATSETAPTLLDRVPRSREDAIVATAERLLGPGPLESAG